MVASTCPKRHLELVHESASHTLPSGSRPCHALPADLFGKFVVVLNVTVEGVKIGASFTLPHKNIAPEPPGEDSEKLVLHVSASWHAKDIVEFFESEFLGNRS